MIKGELYRINESIASLKIRLVDADGEMVGIITKSEGLKLAEEAGLDLVEIVPNAEPPVCKLLDYGKFKYEQQKKKAEAKKKQKIIEVKEIQLRPMIGEHDFLIKCAAIDRFIKDGNKVKITLRFRGREMSHQEIGMQLLNKLKEKIEEIAKIDQAPKLEGKQLIMLISPK